MPFAAQNSAQRIISLAPSVTSILAALGARRQLVAVSKWCKDVADVDGLPELGDCWALAGNSSSNVAGKTLSSASRETAGKSLDNTAASCKTAASEKATEAGEIAGKTGAEGGANAADENAAALLALKPTLIIGSVPFKTETVEEILKLPVPFLALNQRSLADVEMDIRTLGLLANAKSRAEALIREMRGTFGRIRKATSRAKSRPRVYCEAWPNPRISSPPWIAELVEICGGKMAVPAGGRVSDDDVTRANPEIIVLAWAAVGGKSKPEQALNNPAWSGVSAIREKKVFAIRDELLNTPGPPLMRGAEELLRVIHPEIAVRHRKSKGLVKVAL